MKNFLSIIFVFIFSLTAHADLYDIDGISIEAELSSAKEARSIAIADGQADAFWRLMQKMVSPEDLARVPFLEQENIAQFVQNVSLTNEKTTPTRYIATLGVRFYPDKIQTFLTENQIPFLQRSLPTTLIIPVFQKGNDTLLLTDNNPVYTYFKENTSSDLPPYIVLPVGDLEEITLTQTAWENQDYPSFLALAEKYDTQRILFFIIRQNGPHITVITRVFSKETLQPNELLFEQTDPMGNITASMPVITQKVWALQESTWRKENTNDLQAPLIYWIRVPITHLTDWNHIQKLLDKAEFLNHFDVRAFRKNEVFLLIQYKGSSDMLNEQLKKIDLHLELSTIDGLWDLTFTTQETP